jgi:hypothetical protein
MQFVLSAPPAKADPALRVYDFTPEDRELRPTRGALALPLAEVILDGRPKRSGQRLSAPTASSQEGSRSYSPRMVRKPPARMD